MFSAFVTLRKKKITLFVFPEYIFAVQLQDEKQF